MRLTTLDRPIPPLLQAGLLILLLTACAGAPPPVPDEHFYRLPQVHSATPLAQPLFSGTLAIGALDSAGIYNDRALLHSEESTPTQLQRYHYHSWTESPPRLVQDHLTLFLRHARTAPVVIPENPRNRWQYLLNGKLRRFERITGAGGSKIVVAIEFQLLRQGENQPLLVKDYSVTEPAAGERIDDTVAAFSNGLLRTYEWLLRDLQQIKVEGKQ